MRKPDWFLIPALIIVSLVLSFESTFGRDGGQWPDNDTSQWYRALMQPDVPTASCCGPADAYYCENPHTKMIINNDTQKLEPHNFCTINDDRDDGARGRPHIDNGTEIEIPDSKLKWSEIDPQRSVKMERNPTGHGIVFLSRAWYVFCYVQSGGV
jgi:hypothetical protein